MVKFEELSEEGQVAAMASEMAMLFTIMIYLGPWVVCEGIAHQLLTRFWHEVTIIILAFALIVVVSSTLKRLRGWLFSRTYKIALGSFKKEMVKA